MKAKCAKCGKELSLFDKVKLEDGYLCKKCAKEFKKTIDEKKVNFKALSLAELSNKEAAAKKKNAGIVIGIIAMFLVAFLILAGLERSNTSNNNGAADDPNSVAVTDELEETTETEENEEDSEIEELEYEMYATIGKPVFSIIELARDNGYNLKIINFKKEDITNKYSLLTDDEQSKYRTVDVKKINHDSQKIKILAATVSTLEKRMKNKFKKLKENDPLSDAFKIADDEQYVIYVKNRKGKLLDDEDESFNVDDYVYISINKVDYDENKVVFTADTLEHVEAEKEAKEEKKKEQAFLDGTVYISPTGNCYHDSGCPRCTSLSPISRREAQRRGLSPCSICHPDWGW